MRCSKIPSPASLKCEYDITLKGGKLSKLKEIREACEDRHPRLYSNLEQLLNQRQRIAKSIFTPSGTDTEEELQKRMHAFDEVQGLIKQYLAL